MKLIDSKVEYMPQEEGLDGIYKHIERCGRVCFKSENKITENSAEPFVEGLIKSKHMSVLEHGTVYLTERHLKPNRKSIFEPVPYTVINEVPAEECGGETQSMYAVTTNMRVFKEYCMLDGTSAAMKDGLGSYEWFIKPTKYHTKRYTFKFTCSRGIADELRTHRQMSWSMESTRYCNYSKGKYGEELTFIRPLWAKLNTGRYDVEGGREVIGDGYIKDVLEITDSKEKEDKLIPVLLGVEHHYMNFTKRFELQPQQAREILPLCLKVELVCTGTTDQWRHLLDVRLLETTGKVAPEMKVLMEQLKEVMIKENIWEEIYDGN